MADRVSQEAAEVSVQGTGEARISQEVTEAILAQSPNTVRISQEVIEALATYPVITQINLSQIAIEVIAPARLRYLKQVFIVGPAAPP